jgi:hypothetical protein
MLEVYNDATNRIEADSAAEAEFQKALFKRVRACRLLLTAVLCQGRAVTLMTVLSDVLI